MIKFAINLSKQVYGKEICHRQADEKVLRNTIS